jgi:uracil-DNA glycosylase family 4
MATKRRFDKAKVVHVVGEAGSVSGLKPPRPRIREEDRVPGIGPQPARIMLVGERPGEQEFYQKKPFVGPSGMVLNGWLSRAGLGRDKIRITNLVTDYLPTNPDPLQWEIDRDRPRLQADILATNPEVIGAVGRWAARALIGDRFTEMDDCHGMPFCVDRDQLIGNGELEQGDPVVVIPIYHPANALYNIDLGATGEADIGQLSRVIWGDLKPPVDEYGDNIKYTEETDVCYALLFRTPAPPLVAIDTEGSRKFPWCLTYSYREGEAFCIARNPEVPAMKQFQLLLALWIAGGAKVLLHNAMHDLSVLRGLGIDLPPDCFIDTLIMAYQLFTEPRGLKALAYRHRAMKMSEYLELIQPTNDRLAVEYLEQAWALVDMWPTETEPSLEFEFDWETLTQRPKMKQPWPIRRYLARMAPSAVDQIADQKYADYEAKLARWQDKRAKGKKVGKCPEWKGLTPMQTRIADAEDGRHQFAAQSKTLRERWAEVPAESRRAVEEVLGLMPEATLDDVPRGQVITYACRDADGTLRIYPVLRRMHDRMVADTYNDLPLDGPGILQVDLGAIPMFERMQSNGIKADIEHLTNLGIRLGEQLDDLRHTIHRMTKWEINPNSPEQTSALLFGYKPKFKSGPHAGQDKLEGEFLHPHLGLSPGKYTKGGKSGVKEPSTQDKVLEAMRFVDPVMPHILDYREASKIKDSFCEVLPQLTQRDGRIRTTIKVASVRSGRIAMVDPNLTAQPVRSELGIELRNGFVAEPGCVLGTWDLDQIEMREMAHQSRDPLMIELLTNPNRDIHSETAARTFGLKIYNSENKKERYLEVDNLRHRYPAKRVGFGVITGITGKGLVDQMAVANATKNGLPIGQGGELWTEDDCDRMIFEWFKQYRGVERFLFDCRREAEAKGFVKDRWGRIRYLPGVYSEKKWEAEEALRQSHSHKISSSAQGILKMAMAAIWHFNLMIFGEGGTHRVGDTTYPGPHVEPLLQIHDELVYEVADDPELKERWDSIMVGCLTETTKLIVPIRAKGGYGLRWGQLEK